MSENDGRTLQPLHRPHPSRSTVPDPGNDPAVITDAALLAAVSALLPAAE